MKKLVYLFVGVLFAACVLGSCKKESGVSPDVTGFIIAYSEVTPYNGKVNVEFPVSYNISGEGESFWIILCDCDTKAQTLPSVQAALPSVNPLYDSSCSDRSLVAYYRQVFYDSVHGATMYFNREER